MNAWKSLSAYRDSLDRCVRCGACQAGCPAYQATRRETASARAKVALASCLLDDELATDAEGLRKSAGLCLLCGSCQTRCPNQVPGDALAAALRQRIAEEQGPSLFGRLLAGLTGSSALLSGLFRGAGLFSPLFFAKIPKTSGLRLRFPVAGLKARSLPPLSSHNLFRRVPAFLRGDAGKPVLGIFAGCGLSYLYPGTGQAMALLLHQLGYSVFLPRDQGCCGMPALAAGLAPLAARLARRNLAAFNGPEGMRADCIVTACASCCHMLAPHYPALGEIVLPAPVRDIHVFLHEEGLAARLAMLPRQERRERVTYHDPCHLRNQGVTEEPRALLRVLPQAEFVEMDGAGLCCGLGGTFAASHPELSHRIGEGKLEGLRASGASLLATACPGCLLQLQDIAGRAGLPVRAVHTMDLIASAMAMDPALRNCGPV